MNDELSTSEKNRIKADQDEKKKVLKANPELKDIEHSILTTRQEVITKNGRFRYYDFKFCDLKPYHVDYSGLGWKRSIKKRK